MDLQILHIYKFTSMANQSTKVQQVHRLLELIKEVDNRANISKEIRSVSKDDSQLKQVTEPVG